MGYLTREEILGAEDILYEDVPVPEWGGTVRVRGLSGTERDAFEASIVEMRGRKTHVDTRNLRAKLVARAVVGENSQRLFQDGDVRALGEKSAAALNRVFEVAQRLSGLTEADIEELTKNSEGDQSDGFTSD